MFYDRLTELCLSKFGKTPQNKNVMQTLGVSTGILSRWKNADELPNAKTLIKLSQLFEISLDYLVLGINTEATLTDDESILISNYRKLSDSHKSMVMERASTLVEIESEETLKEAVPV